MRGSPKLTYQDLVNIGIIPAHAGLTHFHVKAKLILWDHPRACGAHSALIVIFSLLSGSSPRMRGSLRDVCPQIPIVGIIPAHAGLTLKNPNIDAILSGPHPIFYSVLRVIL